MKRFILVFSSILCFFGSISTVQAAAATIPAPAVSSDYRLAAEDVLLISVWKEEDLQAEVLVRPDGRLNFPLIGELMASGKTIEQIRAELARRLTRYIPDPVVSVSLVKVGGNKVFVIGEVNKPGLFMSGQYIDVMQALSLAGGLTAFADRDGIHILRRTNGQQQAIAFDYDAVARGKMLKQNILLKNGDVIVIP